MKGTLASRFRAGRGWCLAAASLCAMALAPLTGRADTDVSGGMLRYPDVGQSHVVFVYGNDLWLVPKEGGTAQPLASPPGQEQFPRFSGDGKQIAFMGNYEGGRDIYTIPVAGGIARRLTYNPAREFLCDWAPDGRLLFFSNAESGLGRQNQLFLASADQPLPEKLVVPYGDNGALSPDGTWLAYTPWSRDFRTWKRYRGGMASDIWLFNLKTNKSQRMTTWEGTDTLPMWHGQTVYYLSDAGDSHRLNLWSYDTATGARKQVTHYSDYDVKWPSIGPEEIVFQHGSGLYLLDLKTGEARELSVTIPGDRPQIRPHTVDASEFLNGADLSPSAKRVAVEARGDIWTLPAKNGSSRNLTRTNGVAERDPAWSPDGRWIAYFADLTGEYELYVKQSDGRGETRRLTENGDCYRYSPTWSPDSQKIAFTDKTGAAWIHDLESNQTTRFETDPWANRLRLNWSHDGRWITYAKSMNDDIGATAVWIYDVENQKKHRVTHGRFRDSLPTFDRKGEFLYFASSRAFESPLYEDIGTTFIYANTEVLVAVPLRADVKLPSAPKSDEETWESEKKKDGEKQDDKDKAADEQNKDKNEKGNGEQDKEGEDKEESAGRQEAEKQDDKHKDDEPDDDDNDDDDNDDDEKDDKNKNKDEKDDDKDKDGETKKSEPFQIEFQGFERRAVQLPVERGIFSQLGVNDKGQLIYARRPPQGSDAKPGIYVFDWTEEKPESKSLLEGASSFTLTPDGKKLLAQVAGKLQIVDAAAGQKPSPVSTDGMSVVIDPREEWKQLFAEAWRVQRDFFYDPNMHGVDWKAVRKQYERMLADCTSREDVGYVIGEMISELNVGHAYYFGGDLEEEPSTSVAVPGCLFTRHDNAYRVAKLHEGAAWDLDARNPLKAAGVKAGDYLLAVNGVPVSTDKDPYFAFQGLAGKVVTLSVSDQPKLDGESVRQIVVRLPGSDTELRYRQWIERNRKYVEEQSDGKIGYVYVPNTGVNGQNDLVRQFYSQLNKQALIIDDRWNGGGQIPTRFIEMLNRPVTNYWARRDGRDWTWPPDSHQGPKCMLINGLAGSGGDMFPALFRQAGIGKLIGMRTWGGLVGISGNPSLIDGGYTSAPTFAYYETDGTWGIEGHGVDPDIEVVDDPAEMVDGGDPQLDAAIKHLLQELEQRSYKKPARPAYPDRSKFGITDEDR